MCIPTPSPTEAITPAKFESYVASFNMMPDTSFQPVIASLILGEVQRHAAPVVLDIGCGRGIGGRLPLQRLIASAATEFWGVEPDPLSASPPDWFARHVTATLEQASLPDAAVDVAYGVFVMEHVADPRQFLVSAARVLKPKGTLLLVTPNASAFFGFASRWLRRLRVDEYVLRLLRRQWANQPDHYPIQSRCNTEREFRRAAMDAGFEEPAFAYFQFDGVQGYFPGPLRPFFRLLLAKRRLLRDSRSLDTLVCRLVKPTATYEVT